MKHTLVLTLIAILAVATIAAAQSQQVTVSLDRATAEALYAALGEALAVTTTTAPATTTTVATTTTTEPTTTTLPATTTTAAPTTTTTAAPTTTTAPPAGCTGLSVPAGTNLVTVANAQPAGTTFCLTAGTYNVTAAISFQSGDRWIGAGNRQTILTGGGTTAYLVTATSDHVLLQNMVLERFANAAQQGINTGAQTFWTWDNLEIRENKGFGLHLHNDSKVTNSFIHHNHQAGVGGGGDRILVQGNEISNNNYLQEYQPGWEAGASKFVHVVGGVIRNNNVHNNCGPGIWFDGLGNTGNLIEGNTVVDNAGAGIFYELSNGPTVIRNNYVEGNALGEDNNPACTYASTLFGIYVSDSRDVEVYGNTVVGNEGGIGSQQSGRAGALVSGVYFHDNDVTYTIGWSGFRCNDGSDCSLAFPARFENNHYDVPTVAGQWWNWKGTMRTWSQWQAIGHDDTGTVN